MDSPAGAGELKKEIQEELVAAQGPTFPRDPRDLLGNFWPEEESIDDFLAEMRVWRGRARTDPAA